MNNKTEVTKGAKTSTGSETKSATGKKQKTLEELFEDGLKDIYSAETQLVEALPDMVKAAYSEDLQDAFSKHLQETKRHVERLEKIFNRMNISKSGVEKCKAMEGLIAENKKLIEEYDESAVRDSGLIIGAQKVEHYEIASYGSLCELADVLGYSNIHDLLGRTLDEEEYTDNDLSDLSTYINDEAYEQARNTSGSGQERYATAEAL
ncbi:MAG: ferritin-like domain-containing protein [Bacteroidia bacterium]|nr:ferritin-like domain-containing protein [Bacteroidia bacterium]